MKKVGVFAFLFLLILMSFVLAADDNETTTSDDDSDEAKIKEAFACLEEEADDCSDLTTQEIALVIMATPDNIFDDCVDELLDRESGEHWSNVRDTALAILALQHAGKDTTDYEEWLLEQEETPEDLIWYIQEDSNEATECHIGYDTEDYTVTIGENKKISKAAGSCLDLSQSSFWFEVDEDCFDTDISIQCDQDFIANLLYKNEDSSTIYVLEGTETAPAYDSVTLNVKSKCFGSGSCDYEATVWATIALLEAGYDVEDYIPYIVAMSDSNEEYLPDAFVYMLTNYEDYASTLVSAQELGNYWLADSTEYDKYYDTGLALLALGSSSADQIDLAKEWLLFSQPSSGCWNNDVVDTAMVLWGMEGRSGRSSTSSGSSVTYCTTAGYYCITSSDCPTSEEMDNFFCPSLSETCCLNENLKTCSEYGGEECVTGTYCDGNTKTSSDIDECCTGTCVIKEETESECESNYYTCYSSCSENQEELSYDCDDGKVCCTTKTASSSKKSLWWLWVILGLLIVLVTLAIIYKDKVDKMLKKLMHKEDKGGAQGPTRPGMPPRGPPTRPGMPPRNLPPRPGFPPVVRGPMPPARQRPIYKEDPAMKETFRKLRDIAAR